MKVIAGLRGVKDKYSDSVIAIGTFDGIHRGHQSIIKKTVAEARKTGKKSVVITFDMHPANVLGKGSKRIYLISSLDIKREVMKSLGVDVMVVVNFTPYFAGMLPGKFIKDIIYKKFGAKKVIVGEDFSFGREAKGSIALLKLMGKQYGFKLFPVPMLTSGNKKISSTRIRKLILSGKVREASELLGRDYTLTGRVVKGMGRGREMSFPTANMKIEEGMALPSGVYEVKVNMSGKSYTGVANIGCLPTFKSSARGSKSGRSLQVEVHVCDFSGGLYRKKIAVSFIRHIRNEKKFMSKDELSAQIRRDVSGVIALSK